ncbi:MAG TPA: hypothetical protein VLK83_00975 [Rhodanobacteraceae bacterium]|nr:hypothetical protein [Rhodanobacteraceae bacterium]
MNIPAPTPANATLTVSKDAKGALQYAWSGSYINSTGDFDFTSVKGPIQVTLTISTNLQISYCLPAAQTMWLGQAGPIKPTQPYSGTEFSAPTFPTGAANALQWTDQNSDGLTYEYILLLWEVDAGHPTGVRIKVDPRVINRGASK